MKETCPSFSVQSKPGPPPLPEAPSDSTISLLLEERAKLKERGLVRLGFVQTNMESEASDESSDLDDSSSDSFCSDDEEADLEKPSASTSSGSLCDIRQRIADLEHLAGHSSIESLDGMLMGLQDAIDQLSVRRAAEKRRTISQHHHLKSARARFLQAEARLDDLCQQLSVQIDTEESPNHDAQLNLLDQIDAAYLYLETIRSEEVITETDSEKLIRLERENAELRTHLDLALKEIHLLKLQHPHH